MHLYEYPGNYKICTCPDTIPDTARKFYPTRKARMTSFLRHFLDFVFPFQQTFCFGRKLWKDTSNHTIWSPPWMVFSSVQRARTTKNQDCSLQVPHSKYLHFFRSLWGENFNPLHCHQPNRKTKKQTDKPKGMVSMTTNGKGVFDPWLFPQGLVSCSADQVYSLQKEPQGGVSISQINSIHRTLQAIYKYLPGAFDRRAVNWAGSVLQIHFMTAYTIFGIMFDSKCHSNCFPQRHGPVLSARPPMLLLSRINLLQILPFYSQRGRKAPVNVDAFIDAFRSRQVLKLCPPCPAETAIATVSHSKMPNFCTNRSKAGDETRCMMKVQGEVSFSSESKNCPCGLGIQSPRSTMVQAETTSDSPHACFHSWVLHVGTSPHCFVDEATRLQWRPGVASNGEVAAREMLRTTRDSLSILTKGYWVRIYLANFGGVRWERWYCHTQWSWGHSQLSWTSHCNDFKRRNHKKAEQQSINVEALCLMTTKNHEVLDRHLWRSMIWLFLQMTPCSLKELLQGKAAKITWLTKSKQEFLLRDMFH